MLSNNAFITLIQQNVQFNCVEAQAQPLSSNNSLSMICFPVKIYEFLRSNARDQPDTQIFKLLLRIFAEDCKVDYSKTELREALRQYQPDYLTQQETRSLI